MKHISVISFRWCREYRDPLSSSAEGERLRHNFIELSNFFYEIRDGRAWPAACPCTGSWIPGGSHLDSQMLVAISFSLLRRLKSELWASYRLTWLLRYYFLFGFLCTLIVWLCLNLSACSNPQNLYCICFALIFFSTFQYSFFQVHDLQTFSDEFRRITVRILFRQIPQQTIFRLFLILQRVDPSFLNPLLPGIDPALLSGSVPVSPSGSCLSRLAQATFLSSGSFISSCYLSSLRIN